MSTATGILQTTTETDSTTGALTTPAANPLLATTVPFQTPNMTVATTGSALATTNLSLETTSDEGMRD